MLSSCGDNTERRSNGAERFCKEVDGNKGGSGDAKRKVGFFICRRPFHSNPKSYGTCGTMEMFLKASLSSRTMLPY
jgi:hypothetical protein